MYSKKFIVAIDKVTADKLKAMGFKLANQIGSLYTFLNEEGKTINFDEIEKGKIYFTEMLGI